MAVLRCPADDTDCVPPSPAGDLAVPQVGDIVYEAEPGGVVARTDMGCVWHFVEQAGALELAPTGQYCFNPVYGVGYTITDWRITARGDRQREVIHAISHRPGQDYEFVLEDGRRTRVGETGTAADVARFLGGWEYSPASPTVLTNMVVVREGTTFRVEPATGLVSFRRQRGGGVIAETADGCEWKMVIRGNTAHLATAPQVCDLGDTDVTMTHWAIASDGREQFSLLKAVHTTPTTESHRLLTIGHLTRP